MNQLPIYNQILVVLIDFTGFWLLYLIFKKSPKKKINNIFLMNTIFMFLWINFAYFARVFAEDRPDLSLLFLRIAWFATPLLIVFIYFLVVYYFDKEKKYFILNKVIFYSAILVSLTAGFTNLILLDIKFINYNLTIVYGPLMLPFLAIAFIYMLATLYVLYGEFFKTSRNEKIKAEYLLLGISIFYLANLIFNIALPILFGIVRFYWIGDYSSIILLSFIVYAVIKNELFGIKILLSQSLIIIIAILLLSNIFISGDLLEYIWNGILFVSFILFGYYFIRSMRVRMEFREKIESYSRRLKTANNQLKKLDKQKTEFMSFAAHQLRSPLTSVKGFASLIREGAFGKTSKKIKGAAEKIGEASEAMSDSVDDYLNISRIEQGRMEYNLEELDLYELARGVVEEQHPTANKKKIKLTIISDKYKKYPAKADHSKVRQVINNFVDNAVKYTPKGGVEVRVFRKKENAIIAIKDSGIGMKKETIDKLFQRYSRAEDTQGISGTGLGLYIARKMIEAQDGQAWAESKGENRGSTFYIQLPLFKNKK